MNYAVELTSAAEREMDAQADRIAEDKPAAAARWHARLKLAIQSLRSMPRRYPQSKLAAVLGTDVRKLVFGKYMVLFEVDDTLRVVTVIGFRHAARLH